MGKMDNNMRITNNNYLTIICFSKCINFFVYYSRRLLELVELVDSKPKHSQCTIEICTIKLKIIIEFNKNT